MADYLKSVLEEYGGGTKDDTDSYLNSVLSEYGGGGKPPQTGFISDIKRGTGQIIESVGSTLRDVGLDDVGEAIEEKGAKIVRRNPSQINSVEDALKHPLITTREAVGEVVPQVGTAVAGGLTGRVVGGALGGLVGGPIGAAAGQWVGGALGAYAPNFVQEYGGIRSEQRASGQEDIGRAIATGGGAALLDTAFGAERVANKVLGKGSSFLARESGEKLLPHIARQGGRGFLEEAGTEILQTGLERFGAFKELTGSEALNDYGLSAIKGGIGGGVVRGGLSSIAGERQPGSLLGGSNDVLAGGNNPESDAIRQAINFNTDHEVGTSIVPPINPYDVGGYVTAQNSGMDTGLQFRTSDGQQNMVFGDGPVEDVQTGSPAAQTSQATVQPPAAEPRAQQTTSGQQTQEIAPTQVVATGQQFGVAPVPNLKVPTWEVAGYRLYGQPTVQKFITGLAQINASRTPDRVALGAALVKTGMVKLNKPDPQALVTAIDKQIEKLQLGSAATLADVAEIVNDQIQQLALAGKGQTDTNVTNLAMLYENLTGQEAPAYKLTEENIPKKGTNVPKTSTTSTQGAVNGQQQQEQVPSGLGAVPVSSGATEISGRTNVQPANVESFQPGSELGRQNLLQNESLGEGGARLGASNTNGAVSTSNQQTPSSLTEATQKATGEGTLEEKESFVVRLFNSVFGARDGEIVYKLYEQTDSQTQIAKDHGLSRGRIGQIKMAYFEKEQKGKALEFKPEWAQRIVEQVKREGLSPTEVAEFLGGKEEENTELVNDLESNATEDNTPQSAEESLVAKSDEELAEGSEADKNDANLRFATEKNVSDLEDVSERNLSSFSYKKELAAQKEKGAKNPEAEALKKLDDFDLSNLALTADSKMMGLIVTELKRREPLRAARREANKENANAVQEQSAGEVDVRQQAGDGERVGEQNAESEKPAGESKGEAESQTKQEVAQDTWNNLRQALPDAIPEWSDLTKAQRDEVLKLDDPSTLNMKNVERILGTQEARSVKASSEQIKDAKEHAASLGGEVVYQDGDLALIRGYSVMSGSPVYVPAKGGRRAIVDIERVTGNKLLTDAEKEKLVAEKKRLEAAADAKHKEAPFIKFENGLAVSDSVPPRLAGVIRGWKDLLNLKVDLYVTTLDDAKENRNNFTGPHRAIGSAVLNENERGSMRRMSDGSYYVAFSKSTSLTKMLEILAHELGHVHQREVFDNAPDSVKGQIRDDFEKWLGQTKGKTGRELVDSMRARQTARMTDVPDGLTAEQMSLYWKSFSEWYADQVSRWSVATKKPQSVVEQFFAKLAIALRKFYAAVKNARYLPTETFRQYLDEIAPKLIIVPKDSGANADLSSNAIFAGAKSKTFDAGKAAQARVRQAAGESTVSLFRDLGYFVGPDAGVRYEIDDRKAKVDVHKLVLKLEKGQQVILSEVLNHPELYAAYPELKNTAITLTGDVVETSAVFEIGASISPGVNAITLREIPSTSSLARIKDFGLVGFDAEFKNSLLHEAQHLVQVTEGFKGGGNDVTAFTPENDRSLKELYDHTQEHANRYERAGIPDIAKEIRDVAAAVAQIRRLARTNPTLVSLGKQKTAVLRDYMAMNQEARNSEPGNKAATEVGMLNEKILQLLEQEIGLTPEMFASIQDWAYTALSGETEARDVERRSRRDPDASVLIPALADPKEPVVTSYDLQLANKKVPQFMEGLSSAKVYQNINRLPKSAQPTARTVYTTLANLARKANDYVVFMPAIIRRAVAAGIPSAQQFLDLNLQKGAFARSLEKQVEQIVDKYALVKPAERGTGANSVNKFIFDSTRENKWGFEADWQENPRDVDEDLAARFDNFSPEAQDFIRSVFKHGDQVLANKKQTVMDYSATVYDGLIAKAQQAGNQQEVSDLLKQKQALLTKYERLFRLREGLPYAPIKRSGAYVVIAKSDEYRQAQEENDGKRIKELEDDPDHYHVSFKDTEAQARALQQQLLEQGHFGTDPDSVVFRERQVDTDQIYGNDSILAGLTKLRTRVEGTNDEISGTLARMITDLYLDTLAETSARKSEIRRKGVSGEVDMLASFAQQGMSDSNFMASVRYDGQIQQTIQQMRKEEKNDKSGDPNRKSELLNEIIKRYAQSLDYSPHPFTQKLTWMTSAYFLASSPGYFLQNMTQPFLMSLPVMSGRHDVARSADALVTAYSDLRDVFKSAKLFSQQFDFSKVPADVRDVINQLVMAGKIDIGMNTELGEIKVEDSNKYADTWNRVDKGLRLMVQKVESMNRLSTAIAAYRLELEKNKGDKKAAIEYAASVLDDTHGDYTTFVAPRAFNSNLGKVALQFRKFQLIQLGLIAKLFKESGFNTAEKRAASKSLAFLLGTTALAAGLRGLPGYAAIAWALGALFGDDDEPYDVDKELRKAIGDETLANMILRGTPTLAGLDISGKVGMGNALSVLPFTDFDQLNSKKTYEILGTLLGGPAGGMAARMADGVAYMSNGDYWKGLELMMPKGVGDAMKAYRISDEGVTNRRGDVMLKPEDVSFVDSFYQSIGLQPVDQTVRSEKQGQVIEMEQRFKDRTSRLKNDYTAAFRKGDKEGMNAAREGWMKLQETRVANGFTRQPLSNLLKAPRDQMKRERMTIGGVQYNKGNRRFVQSLSEDE